MRLAGKRCRLNAAVQKFTSQAASDIEFDRHVFRLHAAERQPLEEPFAHLPDAAVVVDPHRQEIAPALVGLAPDSHTSSRDLSDLIVALGAKRRATASLAEPTSTAMLTSDLLMSAQVLASIPFLSMAPKG